MVRKIFLSGMLFLVLMLSGCVQDTIPMEELFPPSVGSFLRTTGPERKADLKNVDQAIYQTSDSYVILNIRWVGQENIEKAIGGLPVGAANIVYSDPVLGQRNKGVLFSFGNEYHAAWGNGDWVFILSASSEAARSSFLASYGF